MKMNLYRQGERVRRPVTNETQYPLRNEPCREGRWARKEINLTRGRSNGKPETCNYDIALLSATTM
jgi:hypothetical protein